MTKYLFTTLPSNDLGLLTRSLPIARELQHRGHRVVFCSPARAPRRLISESGFDNLLPNRPACYIISGDIRSAESLFRLLRSRQIWQDVRILLSVARRMSQASTAEIGNIDHFMYLFGMWNEMFVRANVDALSEIIDGYRPDVVVDFWNPFACIAARARKIPLITVIQADMHPQSEGFIWWKQASSHSYPSPVSATNQVLAEYQLPPVQQMAELLTGDMTLVLGIPEMDPLPDTACVKYIGPMLWQKEGGALPQRISDLRQGQPVVWLYPGNLRYVRGSTTFGDSAIVLQACIEALANEAVQVVVPTGYHSLPRRHVSLPPNFHHEPYLPALAMAEMSDLLIHHGGYGSCQTGLVAGKPALIIPTYSERESNARRIAAQRAGDFVLPTSDLTGKKKRVSAGEVRSKVFDILSDASYGANAKRLSESMKGYGGAPEAARLIEDCIGQDRRQALPERSL